MEYHYQASGITISSAICLPELLPFTPTEFPDLTIDFGIAPEGLTTPHATGPFWEVAGDRFLLSMEGVARYLASGGRRVIIDPAPGADDLDLRAFLLSTIFGMVLHQRHRLVLHGSAVVVDGAAVVFLGHSRAGKSTLVAHLARRGHPILCDDLAAITTVNGQIAVYPGMRKVKLWADALDALTLRESQFSKVRNVIDKHYTSVPSWPDPAPLAVRKIYALGRSSGSETFISKVDPVSSFSILCENTYRLPILRAVGDLRAHAADCASIVRAQKLHTLTRPWGMAHMDGVGRILEQDLAL